MESSKVLLVGCGPMAVEYARVLKKMNLQPLVVGRGQASADKFTAEAGYAAEAGGIDAWLASTKTLPDRAIVSVGEKWIGGVAMKLVARGVRHLLLEKPGGFDADDIHLVHRASRKTNADVRVGYNRRYFASVEAARKLIREDGGVTSFNFEFTEWSHVIAPLPKEDGVKEQWFLANSTHVIDLAFHLGGLPVEMASFSSGGLRWHPQGSVFSGAGRSALGALFSYQANWEAPGRWGVEVLTRKHRLILRPLEQLHVQKIGNVAIEKMEIDDSLDKQFKPGLYRQVDAFFHDDRTLLPSISEQVQALDWYLKIRGDKG